MESPLAILALLPIAEAEPIGRWDEAITAISPLLKIILKGFAMQIIPSTYWNP